MPTLLTHPAVPLALALGLGERAVSKRLLGAGIVASVLPDLDVLAFNFGVPYWTQYGHRGISHSLVFALLIALIGLASARRLQSTRGRAFAFLFVATASHGALDALTNGGLGVLFLWPFSGERLFWPVRPIEVSPIGLSRFVSARGLAVLRSELVWVWLPLFAAAAAAFFVRRSRDLRS